MSSLRKFAKGQDCALRIPNICNHNPETVVGAHVKPQGFGAMGSKPSDLFIVHACSGCHAFIDRNYANMGWTRQEVEVELFRALIETQERALSAGLVCLTK